METLVATFKKNEKFPPSKTIYEIIKNKISIRQGLPKSVFQVYTKRLLYVAASFLLGMVLMRTIDFFSRQIKSAKQEPEFKYETRYRSPLSDTVKFYSVLPKNLARI